MFLHIGNDILIPLNSIIMILNLEKIKSQKNILAFLDPNKLNKTIKGEKVKAKSCVITDKYIYYTKISSSTLEKRYLGVKH